MSHLNNTEIRLILTSELKKLDIEIPNIQRIINTDKIEQIVKYQLLFFKKNGYFNFSAGPDIIIHILDSKHLLLDGQHRFMALEQLYNNYSHDVKIHVKFVNVSSKMQLEENYSILNKNTSLPDFSEYSEEDKTISERISLDFQMKYPGTLVSEFKTNRPKINFNYFQESIAWLSRETEITSYEEIKLLIENYNNILSRWDRKSFENVSNSMYEKAKMSKNYLGLFLHKKEEYGYLWAKNIMELSTGKTAKKILVQRKKNIPKNIKNDSWDKYVGKGVGESLCLCCRTKKLNSKEFSAGHIVSEAKGGKTIIENIVPICSLCNLSMGTMNMGDFIKNHYPKNYQKFLKKDYRHSKKIWGNFI